MTLLLKEYVHDLENTNRPCNFIHKLQGLFLTRNKE